MKPYLMIVAFVMILASSLISCQPVEIQQLTLEDVDGQQQNDVNGPGIRQVRHFFGGGGRRGYFGGGGGNPYGRGAYPYNGGGGYYPNSGYGNSYASAQAQASASSFGR
ncbi:uncharacterized protein Dwil_GK20650 [Drosophila willistoni]|uniref:Uncharacterized protein n=1 Tax=Drosophila willistoni TaxID=7260 RepID=B4MK93_DROWI|nr:glycine-rich cell wall structural protein [Drosophila willistoni]EDW72532.1 uncharacterized protein Dwil_GK20650 [Drosophila willistoni]